MNVDIVLLRIVYVFVHVQRSTKCEVDVAVFFKKNIRATNLFSVTEVCSGNRWGSLNKYMQ